MTASKPAKRPKVPRSHPVRTAGQAIYTCSSCGATFNWGPACAWFGTIAEWDEGEPLIFTCGDACREKLAAVLGVFPKPILDFTEF